MTVNTTNIVSGPYTGNGVTTQFSYGFRVDDKTQLVVYETDDLGVESVLVVDVDYTVNNVGDDAGGTIDRIAGALPTDYTWYIRSNYLHLQLTAFASQGGFFPDVHEAAMDLLTFLSQQQEDRIARAMRFNDSYSGGADPELPVPEADKVLVWSSDALNIINGPSEGTFMGWADAAIAAAAAAVISADAAAASAVAADLSKIAAALSETNAGDAANAAIAAAAAAAIDKAAAAVSAAAALVSQGAASDSEAAAAASAAAAAIDQLAAAASAAAALVSEGLAEYWAGEAQTAAGANEKIAARNAVQNQDAVSQGLAQRSGMSSTIYTGNGTSQSIITGVDMSSGDFGGFNWIKNRDAAISHALTDSVRGDFRLESDTTAAESATTAVALTSTGFDLVTASNRYNQNSVDYVAWSFQTNKKASRNIAIYPEQFDNAVWAKSAGIVVTPNAQIAPNGFMTADELAHDGVNNRAVVQSPTTLKANTTYTFSIYLKIISGSFTENSKCQLAIYGSGLVATSSVIIGDALNGDSEWQRFEATATTNGAPSVANFSIRCDELVTLAEWGAQIEEGSAATDYQNAETNHGKPYECHYNTEMGFSIVGYEGDEVAGHEIPHHLGGEPELTIYKNRESVYSWIVKGAMFQDDEFLFLNATNALATGYVSSQDDTTLTVDDTEELNEAGINIIAYNFRSIAGVSKIGKYIGTAATGNYVDCGFIPRFVMLKTLDSAGGWAMYDTARGIDQVVNAESSDAETTNVKIELTENGFVLIGTSYNALDQQYLFITFAETDSDANKSWTDYDYAVDKDVLVIEQDTLVSFANGFSETGQVDTQFNVGSGVTYSEKGDELVTNGTFDTDTDWNKGAGWSIGSGVATSDGANGNQALNQIVNLVEGDTYQVSFEVTAYTAGLLQLELIATTTVAAINVNATGVYTVTYVAEADTSMIVVFRSNASSPFAGGVDNVSVKVVVSTPKKLYLFMDKTGLLGSTEFRPLVGLSRDEADFWGVESPLDPSLRTAAHHFDYESSTGVASASIEESNAVAWEAVAEHANEIVADRRWLALTNTLCWWQYKGTEKRILKSWRIRAANIGRLPQRFTIEGSNDGLNWTAIDSTYTNSDFNIGGSNLWGDLEDTSANTTAYLYHRINITANGSDPSLTGFASMEFNTELPSDYYLIPQGEMFAYRGDEVVVNGTFDVNTDGWSPKDGDAELTVVNQTLRITNGAANGAWANQALTGLIVGETYEGSVQGVGGDAGASRFTCGSSVGGSDYSGSGADNLFGLDGKTYTFRFVAVATTAWFRVSNATALLGAYYDYDNITVKQVGVQIERTYLAEFTTDSDGDVSSFKNLTPAKQYETEMEVLKTLTVRGEIHNPQVATAWGDVDGTVAPPLVSVEHNIAAIVGLDAGSYYVEFNEPMDTKSYVVVATIVSLNTNHNRIVKTGNKTVRGFELLAQTTGSVPADAVLSFAVFGGKD